MNRDWASAPLFDPREGVTIAEPPGAGAGCWAGAPSVWQDESGDFWLVYRLRRPRPERGYLLRIARSADGKRFTTVWEAAKEAFGTQSVERCALLQLEANLWRLLACSVDSADGRWRIDALDAPSPDRFDPARRRPMLTAADTGTEGVKDPVPCRVAGLWHLLVSFAPAPERLRPSLAGGARVSVRGVGQARRLRPAGPHGSALHSSGDVFATGLTRSATGLAVSDDAERWEWRGEVFGNRPGAWDAYAARIGTVVHSGPAFVACYDGSRTVEENYEERTGLAFSFDLRRWERVSLSAPALASPHGSGSLRYMEVVPVGGEWWCYYEMARADGSHELRLSRAPAPAKSQP